MNLLRLLLCISFSIFAFGCGDDTSADASVATDATGSDALGTLDVTTTDTAVSTDGGSADTETRDAPGEDAGGSEDAGTFDAAGDVVVVMDTGIPDSGSACETRVEDRIAGVCDGMGMRICTNWAMEHGGMNAVAQCVQRGGLCARADACTDGRCTCGGEAECADTEMCVSGVAGFSCVCISPRP